MDNNIQLFRQFLSNQFKGGGKKDRSHSRPSYNEQTFLQDYNTAWKGTRYDTPEWRTFWTKLAKRESSFNPQVMNSIGAKGYFQLMPYNRSSTWQNNTQQFAEADKLIRSMEAKITADDLRRAEALGLNKQALLAGAWLGGIGGMRAALRGKTRADMNGTTVMSRMKDFNNLVAEQPEVDPVEQYLNTPVGTHIAEAPVDIQYTDQLPMTALVDSNTDVQELDPYTTNTAAYGGDISGNTFAGGGPFSWGMPAMPGLIIAQKLRKLFSSEPQKKPQRNVRTDRKQDNQSKATAQRSQAIENKIYSMLPKQRTPYDIQFIPNKQILINGYNTSTNALDSLAKYAGIHNRTLQVSEMPIRAKSKTKTRPVTKEEALGLSLRETKGGALPYTNDSRTSGDKEAKRAFYNANVFTAFQDIPATALVNDYHYNKTSQTVPPLLDAFQYYAQGDYNRGDPNHTRDVKAAGKEAFQNPQVQRWWDTEGKYWFNGTYQNAGDDGGEHSMLQGELLNIGTQPVKLKANGGNLFYDGGDEEEDIKSLIASQWPATSKINYKLKPQEGFSQFVDENGNPRGTIETITPNQVAVRWSPVYAKMGIPASERPLLEEANRVDYRDYDREGNPIGEIIPGKNYITTSAPGQNTIVYNPQYTKVEDIKQDLLHVMHDDPEYEKLYDIYMTAALNDMDFLYHDFSEGDQGLVEAMMDGAFSRPTNGNLERGLDADATLQAQLDGYLREQFYPGTPEERMAAGYTGTPYAIKNPSLLNAINNIRGYLEKKALGGPLYNQQNPIEGFQGGRQLPLVRQ